MIRSRNVDGALRTLSGSWWDLKCQPTDATEHLNAGTLNGKVVGDSPTGFAAFYMKTCQSLFVTVTMGGTPITALSLLISGLNQFNEAVSETLVYVATGTQQTTLCYKRITGCKIVLMTGTPAAGDTVSLGYSLVAPRVPMLAKIAAGAVLSVSDTNQIGTQPTFTASDIVSGVARYNILAASVNIVTPTTGHGHITAMIDPSAGGV